MGDEFDASVDTSFDDTSSDYSDYDGFDDGVDMGEFIDAPFDAGDLSDAPPDIGSLMDEPDDFADQQTDIDDYTDAPSDVGSPMDESSDIGSIMDDTGDAEPHHAAPNSDISIFQEDGSVDSLENTMAANADTEGPALDGGAFEITPSDVVDGEDPGSLDALMNENAEGGSGGLEGAGLGSIPVTDVSDVPEGDITPADEGVDTAGGDTTDVADSTEHIDEPFYITQSDVERYMTNVNDSESLRQMRDGIASGRIQVDVDTEAPSDDAVENASDPVLVRDPSEQWEMGNNAIDHTVEAMRDDLRDKGMEDGPDMEAIVMAERVRMQEELAGDISGNSSDPTQRSDFAELTQDGAADGPVQEISDADFLDAADSASDVPMDIDYDAIYAGLDRYDFDGIDVGSDVARLDSFLDSFQSGTWENLSLDGQKAAMSDLAGYVKDVIGLDNPPEIVYYNNPADGDYGGYCPSTNTLSVNEYTLHDNNEAADTVAHELWHARQYQLALNPQNPKDYQYQYGFENYIRPDEDLIAYRDQLVEAEARAFAQQFKDRLSTKRRSL